MLTGFKRESSLAESKIHFDPRRYDILGERWLFRAPALSIPEIPLEFPGPAVRFHAPATDARKSVAVVRAAEAA